MGTKGRDMALYLFCAGALGFGAAWPRGLTAYPFTLAVVLAAIPVGYYYLSYIPKALKESKQLGLKGVVLLPLWPGWARLIIRMSGRRIKGKALRACEVHIKTPAVLSAKEFLALLEADLLTAKEKLPGSIFLWETSAPLPGSVRSLVKDGARNGRAFWDKGGWTIPRFPLTGRELRKGKIRHGAILTGKGETQ